MARKVIDGQPVLDRDGVAELTGKAKATVNYWVIKRANTLFPREFDTDSAGRQWYLESEVEAFWAAHQQKKQDRLTDIDRSGGPDELVGAPTALAILGYAVTREIPQYLIDHPDEARALPSGRMRRRWYRKTIWDYADNIRVSDPATGRPQGTSTRTRAPYQYANDARLPELIAMLEQAEAEGHTRGLGYAVAQHLGVDESTASRLLAAARRARQS